MDDNNQNPQDQQQPPVPQPGESVGAAPVAPANEPGPSNAQVPDPGQSVVPPAVAGNIPGNTVQPGVEGPAVVQNTPVVTPQTPTTPTDPNQAAVGGAAFQPQQAQAPQQPQQPVAPQAPQQPYGQDYANAPVPQQHAGPSKKVILIIVLAVLIPTIIGLLVFLVFSSGSKASVEEQLKQDNTTMWSAIEQSYADTGSLLLLTPEAVSEFAATYLPSGFSDPRTEAPYILVSAPPNVGEIQYLLGGKCEADGKISLTGDDTKYANSILLPSAEFYCLDNQ